MTKIPEYAWVPDTRLTSPPGLSERFRADYAERFRDYARCALELDPDRPPKAQIEVRAPSDEMEFGGVYHYPDRAAGRRWVRVEEGPIFDAARRAQGVAECDTPTPCVATVSFVVFPGGRPDSISAEEVREAFVDSVSEEGVDLDHLEWQIEDPWADPAEALRLTLADFLEGRDEVTMTEAIAALSDPFHHPTRKDEIRVDDLLGRLGWQRRRTRVSGRLRWVYVSPSWMPPVQTPDLDAAMERSRLLRERADRLIAAHSPDPGSEASAAADLVATMGQQLADRVRRLNEKHGPFASPHQAWAVCYEELQELFEEVREKRENRSGVRLRDEAMDLAAAALRFAVQQEQEWVER